MDTPHKTCQEYEVDVQAHHVLSTGTFCLAVGFTAAAFVLYYFFRFDILTIILGVVGTAIFAVITVIMRFVDLPNVHRAHFRFHRREEIPLCPQLRKYQNAQH